MQRYFAKEKQDTNLILQPSDLHHIKNVMRNKIGDNIEVVYNEIVYTCKITNLDNFSLEIIKETTEDKENNVNLTVALSLVNEQKFDLIIQKLTELGVSTIIPIKTERSIIKLDDKKALKKIERWQTICKEASEQSKRTKIPKIEKIINIKELKNIDNKLKLICSLNDNSCSLDNYLDNNLKEIMFVIGPEGGFSQTEEEYLLNNGFKSVSLGKRVMRVETAAIYVASIINYVYKG